MKVFLAILLALALTVPATAVEKDQVKYWGGTAASLEVGSIGRFDTASQASLTYVGARSTLSIPYSDIDSFEYSREATRHLGVLPFIAISLVKMRQHRHFFRISYHDSQGPQVVVFEVSKQAPRALRAVLRAHAPQTCPHSCGTGN